MKSGRRRSFCPLRFLCIFLWISFFLPATGDDQAELAKIPSPEEILHQQRPPSWPDWVDVEMDHTILETEELRKDFAQCLSDASSVFLEIANEDLFRDGGLYPQTVDLKADLPEVPVSLTYRNPNGQGFTVKCGIGLQGKASLALSPKRNFRIRFSKKFGPGSLKYPLFGSAGAQVFENLLIRNPTHDSWTISMDRFRKNPRYVNDRWALELARSLGHLSPQQQWIHLYLNDIYWGVYALSERPDEHFAASHLKTEARDLDFFNADQIREGTGRQRREAEKFLIEGFVNTPDAFRKLKGFIDLRSFIDHLICQVYQGKVDWPHRNYFMVGKRAEKPSFIFGAWDSEIGFFEKNPLFSRESQSALFHAPLSSQRFLVDQSGPGFWFRHLRKSEEFRIMMADRLHQLLGPEGMLSPKKAGALYQQLLDEVTPLLLAESLRWGDSQRIPGYRPFGSEWKGLTGPQSWLFTKFFPLRSSSLKEHFRKEKIWPDLEPPVWFTRIDQKERVRTYLKNPNPHGVIVYSIDGSDPRKKWTGKPVGEPFRESLLLESNTRLQARVLRNRRWSALMTMEVE